MKYKTIPDGQAAIICLPNLQAMIYGISIISQNNKGEIKVTGANSEVWELGAINNIDIMQYYEDESELALVAELMPLCN